MTGRLVIEPGSCTVKENDERFVTIEQNGTTFQNRYKRSQDGKFVVAWKLMLNYQIEKSNRVCLIEDQKSVLWCKEFERAWACDVANDGTVAVLNFHRTPLEDKSGRSCFQNLYSIVIIPRNGNIFTLEFSQNAEILAFALSPEGKFLIYNQQRYNPTSYELILHNIQTNKEEWRYSYPKNQVIHELEFKDQHILVYAGPRPSAYIDRKYSFTLDLTGKIIEDDPAERQKQNERDSTAVTSLNRADPVVEILQNTLMACAPTVKATKRSLTGTKMVSTAMSSIMSGQCPLPALYVTVTPMVLPSFVKPNYPQPEGGEGRFSVHVEVVARNDEERISTVNRCIQTISQKEGDLLKNGLAIKGILPVDMINQYLGSGSYFRARISLTVVFPAKEEKGAEKRKEALLFEDLLNLQPGESVLYLREVSVPIGHGHFIGKVVLTTQKLLLLLKNPVSSRYRTTWLMYPDKAQNIIFGEDRGKYLEQRGIRVYFKAEQDGEFEKFKEKFEHWRHPGRARMANVARDAEGGTQQETLRKRKKTANRVFWSFFGGILSMFLLLISLFVGFVAGFLFFSVILIICGVIFLNTITRPLRREPSPSPRGRPGGPAETRKETGSYEEDSVEDSEGDGLMLFDDIMFPPESDDEDP